MMFDCGLQNIFRLKNGQSRSINWENRNGEKGKGGMASSDLGPVSYTHLIGIQTKNGTGIRAGNTALAVAEPILFGQVQS